MNKFMKWLNESFAPKMQKINNNPWILTIKESIMQVMPLIFLGSIFCILTIPGDYISWWPNFWTIYNWTFGMVSIFVAFLIPFNLMEKKRRRKSRIVAGVAGLILFFQSINPQFIADQQANLESGDIAFSGFTSIGGIGAGGMFLAIIAGLIAAAIVNLLGNFSFFKEDSVIPDFVRAWFDSMLPIGLVAVLGWILTDASFLNLNLYQIVVDIFMPLQNFAQNPFGFVFIMFLYCFLYSMGISTWVLTPVASPIMIAAASANAELAAAGMATNANLSIFTDATVYSAYLWIGGIGCTMPLVIMMLTMAKSQRMKALGKAVLVPAVFNINEQTVFGCIAWNPILMVPMWLQGIILPIIIYVLTKVIPLFPIPDMLFNMWYCPFPICTWLTTRSLFGIVLMLIVFAASWMIWMPFFKIYDKQVCEEEAAEQK